MRQASQSALHVICGSINDVEIVEDDFIINVYDKYLQQHLLENLTILKRAFTWQDLSYNIKVVLTAKKADAKDEDIKKLKQIFGEYFKIIGE